MTQHFNWSWVDTLSSTLKASASVDQSSGTFYSFRTAARGSISSTELNASLDSMKSNLNHQWRLWQNNIRPVLDSLPAGARDTRWRVGKGLPPKIDALTYGLQGTTLFVFNDANAIRASGRYWDTDTERPITIAEAFENLWYAIDNLEITSTSSTPSSVDLDPLWNAIGYHYQDPSLTSSSESLDSRVGVTEDWLEQLKKDLYGNHEGYLPWTFGVPLSYSVAMNIDYLLKAHGIPGGWQEDPSLLGHDTFATAEHTHPYTDIRPMPSVTLSQGRVAPYSTLYNDILRIRWEITRTRGSSSWYTDATDPVTSAAGDLNTHMNYVGSGSSSVSNPHAISYSDIGADTLLENLARFVGMTDYTSVVEMPTYSSTNYVTQAGDLEQAIGELDAAIKDAITGFVSRVEYGPYDRSGLSDTQREQTPITIVHGYGQEPVVNIIDLSPDQQAWGMYSTPTSDVVIDFPDLNTIRIWTNAEIVKAICLFGGIAGGAGGETTDHGGLGGLADDDHLQYLLVSGSRAMAGNLNMASYKVHTTSGTLKFSDSYNGSSSWSQTYINLAASAAEWTLFETNFGGEVSLMNAINQAYAAGGGTPSLTDTYIGVGNASNQLSGSANLTYDSDGNRQLLIGAGSPGHLSTTNDSLYVNGAFEVDGISYCDGGIKLPDSVACYFGTGDDASLLYSAAQTNDALVLGLSSDSNTLILCELADIATDFGHAASTDPLLVIQSADATTVAQYVSLSHNQTHAHLVSGVGSFQFEDAYLDGSTYDTVFVLADASGEYDTFETNFGEVSLINALNQAYAAAGGTPSLTDTYIGVGNASNQLSGSANLTYDSDGNRQLLIGTGSPGHLSTTNDSLYVTEVLEVDGVSYFDGGIKLPDAVACYFGTGDDASLLYSAAQTNDALVLGLSSDSNTLILCELADIATDFGHSSYTDPILVIQSADATTVAQYLSLSHNQSHAHLVSGVGSFQFEDAYLDGSTYDTAFVLADASGEYDTFETNFGEVSLINALNQAYTAAGAANTLTETYIGFGDSGNELSGEATFIWNTASQYMQIGTTEFLRLGSNIVTVTNKNKHLAYLENEDGVFFRLINQYWNGSSWANTNGVGIGINALASSSGPDSIAVGLNAGQFNSGAKLIGFGYQSGMYNSGLDVIALGSYSAEYNSGNYFVGLGRFVGEHNSGAYCVGVGAYSCQYNVGDFTVGSGYSSSKYNRGDRVVSIGPYSLIYNNFSYVVAIGMNTLRYNDGAHNIAVGYNAWSDFIPDASSAKTFSYTDVDAGTDYITITAHGFGSTGTFVNLQYTEGTSPITGLTDGDIVQAEIIDVNTVCTSRTHDITAAGTGTGHTLTPQFAYANSIVFGYGTHPTDSNQVTLGNTDTESTRLWGLAYFMEGDAGEDEYLTLSHDGTNAIFATATGSFQFEDAYLDGSTYDTAFVLADTSGEYDTFETNFGEVSLINALNQAYAAGGGTPSLTDTYIGVGNASNQLSGSANLTYDSDGNRQLLIGAGSPGHLSTTNDSLYVNGAFEVDGISYCDGGVKLPDAVACYFGTGDDAGFLYSAAQTNDALVLGLSSDSRTFILCEKADYGTNFGHSAYTDPTLVIQSADATDVTQYGRLTHDQTDFVIAAGSGSVRISNADVGGGSSPLIVDNASDSLYSIWLEAYDGDGSVIWSDEPIYLGMTEGYYSPYFMVDGVQGETYLAAAEMGLNDSDAYLRIYRSGGADYDATFSGIDRILFDVNTLSLSSSPNNAAIINANSISFGSTVPNATGITSGTLSIDWEERCMQRVTIDENVTTVTFSNNPHGIGRISILLSFSGSYSVTGFTGCTWAGTSPPFSGTEGEVYIITFEYHGSSTYYGIISGPFS
jgi:hypothetical protein